MNFFWLPIVILSISTGCFSKTKRTESLTTGKLSFPTSKTISPCNDFYQYVCSESLKKINLPENKNYYRVTYENSKSFLRNTKRDWLFKTLKSSNSNLNRRSMQFINYYKSCIDKPTRVKAEQKIVKQVVDQITKITNNRQDSIAKATLLKLMVTNHFEGRPSYFISYSHENPKNPDQMDYFFKINLIKLEKKYRYADKKILQQYKDFLVEFFKILKKPHPSKRAKNIIDFEKSISKYALGTREWKEKYYSGKLNTLRLRKFTQKYKHLGFDYKNIRKYFINKHSNVMDFHPEYYLAVQQKLTRLPLKTLEDLVLLNILENSIDLAFPKYTKKYNALMKSLGKNPERKQPLKERCYREIDSRKGFAKEIDYGIINQVEYFSKFPHKKLTSLIQSILDAQKNRFIKNEWASKQTKKEALKKIENISLSSIRPDKIEDWGFLEVQDYSEKSYYKNRNLLKKSLLKRELSIIGLPVNHSRWERSPLSPKGGAFYSPSSNQFKIFGGYIYPPIYQPEKEIYWSSAASSIAGHEIGHAFDDFGVKIDSNRRQQKWMPESDQKKFKSLSKIIDTQYDNACVNSFSQLKTISVNRNNINTPSSSKTCHEFSKRTRGENIADILGLQLAREISLPKKHNKKQLKIFFEQYGQQWCSKITSTKLFKILHESDHAPFYMRLNEVVKHLDDFSNTYNCKPGSKMHLPDNQKVKIW